MVEDNLQKIWDREETQFGGLRIPEGYLGPIKFFINNTNKVICLCRGRGGSGELDHNVMWRKIATSLNIPLEEGVIAGVMSISDSEIRYIRRSATLDGATPDDLALAMNEKYSVKVFGIARDQIFEVSINEQ